MVFDWYNIANQWETGMLLNKYSSEGTVAIWKTQK